MVETASVADRPPRRRLAIDPRAIAGGAIVAALFATALAAPLLAPHDPLAQDLLYTQLPPAFEPGDYRSSRKDFNPDTLRRVRAKLARMKERFGSTAADPTHVLASAACRWVLSHEHVCSAIPGFRNARQASCNVRAGAEEPMSAADADWCRQLFAAS